MKFLISCSSQVILKKISVSQAADFIITHKCQQHCRNFINFSQDIASIYDSSNFVRILFSLLFIKMLCGCRGKLTPALNPRLLNTRNNHAGTNCFGKFLACYDKFFTCFFLLKFWWKFIFTRNSIVFSCLIFQGSNFYAR